MIIKIIEYVKKNQKILLLPLGFLGSICSIGRFNMVISIYIWPLCFLLYLHKCEQKIIPLSIVFGCLFLSNMFRWIGVTSINVGFDFLIGMYFSIINIIPFIIDDIVYNKISKLKSIFIFPLSVAFVEFIFGYIPIANFNIYAYAHLDDLAFLQIASLFGCYFVSFIIALFTSVFDYSLYIFEKHKEISKIFFLYFAFFVLLYFFGNTRLILSNNEKTINVASALGLSQKLYEEGKNWELPIDSYFSYIESTMEKANKAGAVMITYAEEAFAIEEDDFQPIVNGVSNYARDKNIFVVLSLDIHYKNNSNTDTALLISNEGEVLYNYHKQNIIPYTESEYTKWKFDIKRINTTFGYVGIVICYDIDFPWFINSLVKKPIDILIVPSWDYPGIAEYHSKETRYRAIEGGFNVIKNTANGIVAAFDVKGRQITYHPGKNCEDYFVITTINNIGFETFYSYFEYFINYLYLVGIIGILLSGKIMKFLKKKKTNITSINALNNENNNAGNNLGLEDKE